jgi:RNA polymerase sigma-70 factor (ECF subfamily)
VQDSPQERDGELIALIARGDGAAFARLVRTHGPAMRRFARALTDEASADDVLQEAMIDAYRGAAGFRGDASVRSWLFTLARNRAFHHRVAAKKREVPDTPLLELGLEAGFGAEPEKLADRVEQRDALTRALAKLAEEEREILILRDVEGLSGEEAATVLGLEIPAMKSRLHRARLRLMTALREIGGDDGG